jgi:hypothetical protein
VKRAAAAQIKNCGRLCSALQIEYSYPKFPLQRSRKALQFTRHFPDQQAQLSTTPLALSCCGHSKAPKE